MNLMTDDKKLKAAVLSMEGEDVAWFQWEDGWRPFQRRAELKVIMLERFQPS